MTRLRLRLTWLLLVLVVATPSAATVPGDLCAGNPCIVLSDVDVDAGSNLDFGPATDFAIAAGVTVTVLGPNPLMSLRAKSIVLEPGAEIRGEDLDLSMLTYDGNLELRAAGGSRARLDLSGPDGGMVSLQASIGSLLADGVIDGRGASPGEPDYFADVDIRLADSLFSGSVTGGFTEIHADGDVEIVGLIATGGVEEGGNISIQAGGSVFVRPDGTLDASTSGPGAPSGQIFVEATTGDVVHEGRIVGTSASAFEPTLSSTISMAAYAGSIHLTGTIDVSAGNNGETADNNEMFAPLGDVVQEEGASIDVSSAGPNGVSYGITFFAGGNVILNDDVKATGGGGGGGTIAATAALSVSVVGDLQTGASNGGDAGDIELHACDVEVSGKLDAASGSTGSTLLEGGRRVVVEGQIKAGQQNQILYDLNDPVVTGTVTPSPLLSPTADSSGCAVLAECGNDLLDVGEACDDGNLVDGDCCDSTCAAESAGNPCAVDWGSCALSQCDGAGACGIATPGAGCWLPQEALRSQLILKDKDPDKGDLVVFKWIRGEDVAPGELPDPTSSDDLDLCLYDPDGRPLFRASAPATGLCDGNPCWSEKSAGYLYKDKERTPDGIFKVLLKAGADGKAKALMKGKGENLPPLPELPVSLPVEAQLKASGGACWEATFDAPGVIRNQPGQFKARATS